MKKSENQLFIKKFEQTESSFQKKKGGPQNRINDLNYSTWMKFQKSFFRYTGTSDIVNSSIAFFTKEIWPDTKINSKTWLLGFNDVTPDASLGKRTIVRNDKIESLSELCEILDKCDAESSIDFIIIDLRHLVVDGTSYDNFIQKYSQRLFSRVQMLLAERRYCSIIIESLEEGEVSFPIAWYVAESSRISLSLRDEKIGISEDSSRIIYQLIFKNEPDGRNSNLPQNLEIAQARTNLKFPSWIIPKAKPRKKGEIAHPAKFPEALISEFIKIFTTENDWILDPMAGTGSTVIAGAQNGRNAIGIELMPNFIEIANDRLEIYCPPSMFGNNVMSSMVQGNAENLSAIPILNEHLFNYIITSPPYWSMLKNPGSENQRARRTQKLQLTYSDMEEDLGNIKDYDLFIGRLVSIYFSLADKLKNDGYITIIVKNVKREHVVYPFAWDLVTNLSTSTSPYDYLGTTYWCQDDIGLKPFAVGAHWVSNTLHQYCLHFKKKSDFNS